MKLGMVGLPNVGKSTLFNALTNAGAESANYPFCTIEKNVGIVSVPDSRLDELAKIYEPDKFTPATLEFVDIAGLVNDHFITTCHFIKYHRSLFLATTNRNFCTIVTTIMKNDILTTL